MLYYFTILLRLYGVGHAELVPIVGESNVVARRTNPRANVMSNPRLLALRT